MVNKSFLGLGKTLYNSSVCTITAKADNIPKIELLLTERITRDKASGHWPERALEHVLDSIPKNSLLLAENRDVITPKQFENILNERFPFYEHLSQKGLLEFTKAHNDQIISLTHHYAHAMAILPSCPFEKSIVMVIDGAGSRAGDFSKLTHNSSESDHIPDNPDLHEECSVYLLNKAQLKCIHKEWQQFTPSKKYPGHLFSEGLGIAYEKVAEYIFNSKRAAGKVMGLASFGTGAPITDRLQFCSELEWDTKSFKGRGKEEWETCGLFDHYADMAASIQLNFEKTVLARLKVIRDKYPDYHNLIITGGCALNCTANTKIYNTELFKDIYVPALPSDESISLGAASYLFYEKAKHPWKPTPYEEQHNYWGKVTSIPTDDVIKKTFDGYKIVNPDSIIQYTADRIADNKVIAWFQGRSECGPRALGNRSILARADQFDLKNYLNKNIKFREAFRPYGASVLENKACEYFNLPEGLHTPFMSFTIPVKEDYKNALQEITHIDGTSRIQTVSPDQNKLFYDLIHAVGEQTELYLVLNTSLNIMGRPILETVEDAKEFLDNTPIDGLAIGNYYIQKS